MAETDQTEIEEQLAVWEARGDGEAAEEEPRRRAKVIQLPLWPETKRGALNASAAECAFRGHPGQGAGRAGTGACGRPTGYLNPFHRLAAEPIRA